MSLTLWVSKNAIEDIILRFHNFSNTSVEAFNRPGKTFDKNLCVDWWRKTKALIYLNFAKLCNFTFYVFTLNCLTCESSESQKHLNLRLNLLSSLMWLYYSFSSSSWLSSFCRPLPRKKECQITLLFILEPTWKAHKFFNRTCQRTV